MATSNSNQGHHSWPESSHFRKSIRREFTIYVSGIVLLLMGITGYMFSTRYVTAVTRNVIDKLLVQARSYSGPAGKLIIGSDSPDALLLSNACKRLADENSDVFWAGISGFDGMFLAHTDIRQVVSSTEAPLLKGGTSPDMIGMVKSGEVIGIHDDTIYVTVPIKEKEIEVGKLLVAASTESISEARNSSVAVVVLMTLGVIAVGIPLTLIVVRRKLHPVSVIADHLREVDVDNMSLEIPVNSRNEFGYLAETLRVMGSRLNAAQKELLDKERIEQELKIAREIQASILPKDYPAFDEFSMAGTYRSAREVGGDYYDFIDFDERHLGILVADVSGKSLPGMLVMLMTRDIVRRLCRELKHPENILSEVNKELSENIRKGMFVTMFFGILDRIDGRLRYASAGHNPLVHFSAKSGECRLIKTKGYPLGMMPPKQFDKRIERGELSMQPNDLVIQYTDGINEALNEAEEEYGLDRLVDFTKANGQLAPEQLVTGFMQHHERFVGSADQYDDITLIALKWLSKCSDIHDNRLTEALGVGAK